MAAGTAYAQPAQIQHADAQPSAAVVHATDHGVSYTTRQAADGTGVVTTLDAGRFALTSDAKAVTVSDPAGNVIATLPMGFQVAGQRFGLRPLIEQAGRSLTLQPVGAQPAAPAARVQAQARFVDEAADLARHQYNAAVGAVIGGAIGALLGFFPWVLPNLIGAVVIGLIGAGVGAGVGWILP